MEERIITADKIVSISTKIENRHIDYADILASVNVVPDEFPPNPFDSDGLEHSKDIERWNEHSERIRHAKNRVWDRHHPFYIEMDTTDTFNYFRSRGASKQVAAELCAVSRRNRIEYIQRIYREGLEYWDVSGEFLGFSDSCCGIDDYDYAYEMRGEIAGNIAYQLEKAGYIVDGAPDRSNEYRRNRIENLRRNANMFNWQG